MAKDYKNKIIVVPRFNQANGFYTTAEKSKAMAKIKGKNTKPEITLRKALWAMGIKYRINVKSLPGAPDILMRKYNLVVFIDGEFWHGYNWEVKKKQIKTNTGFWIPKIERNMQRDNDNAKKLTDMGFIVLRFWEHQIKKDLQGCTQIILSYIERSHK